MIDSNAVIASLKKEFGSFFETEAHGNADYIRYINSGVKDICTFKNFTFNRFTIPVISDGSGTAIVIPYQIETLFLLDEQEDPIDYCDFDDYYPFKDKTKIVGIWDETMITKKSGNFTLGYRGVPNPISIPGDVIQIPNIYQDLLILRALYYGFRDESLWAEASNVDKIFQGMVQAYATRNTNTKPNQEERMGEDHVF